MILVVFMPAGSNPEALDPNRVKIYIERTLLTFDPAVQPYIDGQGRIMVPLRNLADKMGGVTLWKSKEKTAVLTRGGQTIEIPIGSRYFIVDGGYFLTDTESVLKQNRLYVPLRPLMEAMGYGITWTVGERKATISKNLPSAVNFGIPNAYDRRKTSGLTSVKDQGEIGACWAFSAFGAIEAAYMPEKAYDLSEDHLSLTNGYNVGQDEGGDFNMTMAYLARWSGPVLESSDPYGDTRTNPDARAVLHVQEAILLPTKDYRAIKRAIQLYGGVQSSMYFNNSYIGTDNMVYNESNQAFYYNGSALANHAVLIVGWDDAYPAENFNTVPGRDGAFICKNSFGTGFGDGGYFYVSYEDKRIATHNTVYTRIEPTDNYDRIYGTDYLGWVGRLGYGGEDAYFANVYDAGSVQRLEAVGFYATDQGTTYEVYYIPDYKTTGDFERKVFLKAGNLAYKGYYTIDLDQSKVISGRFAVIVKIHTPNSILPVAAEYYKNVSWLDVVDISDGEGYMSKTGAVWERTEDVFKSNVSLKAYTRNFY